VVGAKGSSKDLLYVSGDTVWYEGIAEIARRFSISVAVLNMGAARVEAAGPWHLTFTGEEGVQAARAFGKAAIVPLQCEGWAHFSEHRQEIRRAFKQAEVEHRLCWLSPGVVKDFSDFLSRTEEST
jgi:hypothetical protein